MCTGPKFNPQHYKKINKSFHHIKSLKCFILFLFFGVEDFETRPCAGSMISAAELHPWPLNFSDRILLCCLGWS